ncbi:hypothetical protein IIB49_02580 [Patescibacteria group bacterium]|nr:hypothetical protein [Patescibacteria group bacterium]
MIRDEIVEGLRFAMNKGDSLLKAMMSFYNAGYSKLEVEEAARMLSQPSLQNIQPQIQTQAPQIIPTKLAQGQPKQHVSQYGPPVDLLQSTTTPLQNLSEAPPTPVPGSPQMVSNYGGKNKHPLSTGVMIFLSITLFLLLAALVSLIVFKDYIANFFSGFL